MEPMLPLLLSHARACHLSTLLSHLYHPFTSLPFLSHTGQLTPCRVVDGGVQIGTIKQREKHASRLFRLTQAYHPPSFSHGDNISHSLPMCGSHILHYTHQHMDKIPTKKLSNQQPFQFQIFLLKNEIDKPKFTAYERNTLAVKRKKTRNNSQNTDRDHSAHTFRTLTRQHWHVVKNCL